MNAVDKYYRTKQELLQEGSYAVKIFCDASLKDGVLVSAIYIDDHIRIHTKTKYLKDVKNIQKGEAYAIKMALDHIAKHFYKEADGERRSSANLRTGSDNTALCYL